MRGVIGKLRQTMDVGNQGKDERCDWEIRTDEGRGWEIGERRGIGLKNQGKDEGWD